jgi:hypothetical protein
MYVQALQAWSQPMIFRIEYLTFSESNVPCKVLSWNQFVATSNGSFSYRARLDGKNLHGTLDGDFC